MIAVRGGDQGSATTTTTALTRMACMSSPAAVSARPGPRERQVPEIAEARDDANTQSGVGLIPKEIANDLLGGPEMGRR